jgi:hypothetical protein
MHPKFVAVAVLAVAITVAHAHADQLECFRVKDARQKARLSSVVQGMALPVGCTIKVAAKLVCAPPESAGETAGAIVCSEVKCDAGTAPPSPIVDEVLGEVKARRARLVCTRVTADDTVDDPTTTTTTLPPDGVTTTTESSTTTTTVTEATTTTAVVPFPTCDSPNTSCGSCGNGACQPTRPEGRFVCTFQTQGFCEGSCASHADCSGGKACVGASGEFGQCCTPCF